MNVVERVDKGAVLSLVIDPGSRTPIYAQLCAQIRAAIGARILAPGERLPTMRAVALESRVDLNTVQKAYRELERDGFLITQGTRGSFVAATPPAADPAQRQARTMALAQETVAAARIEGLDPYEVARAIKTVAAPVRGNQ